MHGIEKTLGILWILKVFCLYQMDAWGAGGGMITAHKYSFLRHNCCGMIGFITKQFKQNWYAQDLADLEYLSDLIEECHEKK